VIDRFAEVEFHAPTDRSRTVWLGICSPADKSLPRAGNYDNFVVRHDSSEMRREGW
jgi:hypothetical protein